VSEQLNNENENVEATTETEENEFKVITLVDEDGNENLYEQLSYISKEAKGNKFGKVYALYAQVGYEEDETGRTDIIPVVITDDGELDLVETKSEWKFIESIIEEQSKQ
jgi:uncharacterized protein YrzB (UPF0473 family)